jgi:glycosyltransferase involved in cell wall biosynthesis
LRKNSFQGSSRENPFECSRKSQKGKLRMKLPSIVFDARCVTPELSGIGRYALGLLSGLAALHPPHKIYVLGGDARLIAEAVQGAPWLERLACDWSPWSMRSLLLLPGYLRALRCQVYHCPYVYAPLFAPGTAKVVTVHDLIPNRCPDMLPRAWKVRLRPLWNLWFRMQCTSARAVITVSDFSRQELLEFLHLPQAKVHRIYNGVQLSKTTLTAEDVRRRFGLQGLIISYIGRHDPYKNIAGLIRAFRHLRKESASEVTLVIGGKIDPRYPEAQRLAASLGLERWVVFTDYLDDATRLALLRASSLFVFASHYEGFGLPPLEAMAEGIPVVASNAASLPEILGDAALFVAPNDVEGLARAMRTILSNPALAQQLSKAGRKWAAQFTWEACASTHLALYESLLT